MWVICVGCHHAVEIKPLRKKGRLRCTACGSVVARVVRVLKQSMLNGGQMPPDAAKTLTYAGLISIAAHRGYKPNWARMKYKEIFGEWRDDAQEPQNPSSELLWWIKQQAKAFAKAMGEKEGREWPRGKKKQPEVQSELMSKDDYEIDL